MGSSDVVQNVHVITSARTIADNYSRVMIHALEWHPSAADDDLMVKDSAGNILFKARAQGAAPNGEVAYVTWKSINAICLGLVVETIDGGTLYVYTG
jgi:hypothetical protein